MSKIKNRAKKIIVFIAVLLVLSGLIYLQTEPLYLPTALITSAHHTSFPRYIAHKALVSNNFAANSLEGIEEAMGSLVGGIEIDIRLSKDQIPFLYHGDTLLETTNGVGIPEDYTWTELEQLSYRDANQSKLVRLADVFERVGSQKFIFLDIKTTKINNTVFVDKITELIKQYQLHDTVIVESFNPFFLIAMRLAARDILLMYNFTMNAQARGSETQAQFDQIPWLLKQPFFQKQIRRVVRPDILGPRWNVDESLMKNLIAAEYPIISWTIDDPILAKHLFSLGVRGIESNDPIKLMTDLAETRATQLFDAGRQSSLAQKIIYVTSVKDVVDAVRYAKEKSIPIAISGRRHSMGAQALLNDAIQLDMMGLNKVSYDEKSGIVSVESGATWRKIQHVLEGFGRSVKVMQSDNIFTVGGSLSANVHGWQVGAGPLSSTVQALTVVTADGEIRRIDRKNEAELFNAVLGGYGLFGVIISAELLSTKNSMLKFHCEFFESQKFFEKFRSKVSANKSVELAYGRLSLDREHLFEEAGLFWYERTNAEYLEPSEPESLIALKRAIFRGSQYGDLTKKLRWKAEKLFSQQLAKNSVVSRISVMSSDTHILWPLYGKRQDILHEYFIPKNKVPQFLETAKKLVQEEDMNLLNVTIREVRKDDQTLLAYARQDVFGFVMLFSQGDGVSEEQKMERFTQKLIDGAIKLGGTFYLTYRPHYTKEQLLKGYPQVETWLHVKEKWDPHSVFESSFFRNLKRLVKY